MSSYLSHAGACKRSPSGPIRPGMTALRALGKICRFVSFRALSTDRTPRSSGLGQTPPVVLRKMLSINALGWVFKHLIIGCFSHFFGPSGHMARTLRKDKDARARTQAKPYKAVESGGENEPLTMELRTALLRSRQASPDLRVRGGLPRRVGPPQRSFSPEPRMSSSTSPVRTFLLSLALLFAAASGAQAQVTIESVVWDWDVGANSLDITAVNTSVGSNRALLAAVCLNNNDGQLPVSVVLDPVGASPDTLDWLDVGDQAASWSDTDDGHCTIWGVKRSSFWNQLNC